MRLDGPSGLLRHPANTMRQAIESAVRIFRANPNASEDEILNRVVETGIRRPLAMQLAALGSFAFRS